LALELLTRLLQRLDPSQDVLEAALQHLRDRRPTADVDEHAADDPDVVRLDRRRRRDRGLYRSFRRAAGAALLRAGATRAVEAEHPIDIDLAQAERRLDVQH